MRRFIFLLILTFLGACSHVIKKPDSKNDEMAAVEKALIVCYPGIKLKNFQPSADKWSFQGGHFYEFTDKKSNKKVIKMTNQEEMKNFKALLEYVQKHSLSNVSKYLLLPEFFSDHEPFFYVMPKACGKDFDAFNEEFYRGEIDEEMYIKAYQLLGEIFAYLHGNSIFHWDPHSSNIFFAKELEEKNRISIVDNDEVVIDPDDFHLRKHVHDFKTIVLKTTPFGKYILWKYKEQKPDETCKCRQEILLKGVETFIRSYFIRSYLDGFYFENTKCEEDRQRFIDAVINREELERRFGIFTPSALEGIEKEIRSCIILKTKIIKKWKNFCHILRKFQVL